MPFDYEEYQKKCDTLTTEQLQKEWENYTRQLAGGATSTATSVLLSPFTGGISLVGLGLSGPRIHNARKKRDIIEAGLQQRGTSHTTRKRDVIAPMAVAGTLGTVTLGLAGPGADIIAGQAVGHGVEYAVSHAALDSTGALLEHKHDEHHKKKANEKLQAQYQNFQQQYIQEQKLQAMEGSQKPGSTPQTKPPILQEAKPEVVAQSLAAMSLDGSHISSSTQSSSTLEGGQTSRDKKYEYVSIPAVHSNQISSLPDSHQYTPTTRNTYPPPPAYSAISESNALLTAGRSNSLKSEVVVVEKPVIIENTAEMTDDPIESEEGPDMKNYYPANCPSLFPLFSRPSLPQNAPVPLVNEARTAPIVDEQIMIAELPANEEVVPAVELASGSASFTMEQEIAFLKAKILQMEIEKRQAPTLGLTIDQLQSPQSTEPAHVKLDGGQETVNIPCAQPDPISIRQQNQPNLTLTTTLISQSFETEDFAPAPPPLPPRSPAPPPALQPQNPAPTPSVFYPPPPPSPIPSTAFSGTISPFTAYPPPPPPPLTNNHQQDPALYNPSGPILQQQPPNYTPSTAQKPQHPQYNRHDSGYYSNPPSRHSSSFSSATLASYDPSMHSLSPQSTGNQPVGHRYSTSYSPAQFGPVSPMTPQSTPAFAPPPSAPNPTGVAGAVSGAKDYFSNRLSQYLPDIKKYTPGAGQHPPVSAPAQPFNGAQGWQWGMATPPNNQQNYGPPPPVPQPWRG